MCEFEVVGVGGEDCLEIECLWVVGVCVLCVVGGGEYVSVVFGFV